MTRTLLVLLALTSMVAAQGPRQIARIDTGVAVKAAAVCDEGREIVGIDAEGKLHVWNVASNTGAVIATPEKVRGDLACSSDGHRAALTSSDGSVLIVDLTTRKVLKSVRPTAHFVQGMAFDNAHLLAVSSDDGAPKLFDDRSDAVIELKRPFGAAGAPAFSPDGLLVATPDEDTNVRIYDVNGTLRATVDCGPLEPFFAAFSQDGKQIFVSGADGRIRTIDVSSGKLFGTSEKLGTASLAMSMSGDEALILMMDEYTMAPDAAVIWNAKTDQVRKVTADVKAFIAAGPGKSGWVLVKPEDKAITLWEQR